MKGKDDEEEEEEGEDTMFRTFDVRPCWTWFEQRGERQMGFVVSQGDVAAINDKVRKHR